MSLEEDLDKLISRVDFYESCVDQLKKEIPKYLTKLNDGSTMHKSMAKVFRGVASTEPNQDLQNILFLYGQKQELLEKERDVFGKCQLKSIELIEESESMLVSPLREIISDLSSVKKTMQKKSNSAPSSSGECGSPEGQFMQSTLHIHTKLFEKYRVRNMKKLMNTLLTAELRYHCRVVEELSVVKASLSNCCIEEDENDGPMDLF